MGRVNIYSRDEEFTGERPALLGWYDPDTAVEAIREAREWDGNNHRGVLSGGQVGYEMLFRTKGGRWVRYYNFVNEYNGPEYSEFYTDDQAKDWLLRNGTEETDAIVAKYFGDVEEERGPGRPGIGGATNIRLTDEQRDKLGRVAREGESLAATIRRLIEEAPEPVEA
ncbi:hypothetical protein [Nonomuraea sp. WAC 01424]|uniref:hypothetical protein n=1 Tax=Nonomuraea sp. WAC 01424 TaxID=2203200 RepID=UPI00163CA1F4|nr:hypothetical protein [Nonomuraea sp. WAC 01424]